MFKKKNRDVLSTKKNIAIEMCIKNNITPGSDFKIVPYPSVVDLFLIVRKKVQLSVIILHFSALKKQNRTQESDVKNCGF